MNELGPDSDHLISLLSRYYSQTDSDLSEISHQNANCQLSVHDEATNRTC